MTAKKPVLKKPVLKNEVKEPNGPLVVGCLLAFAWFVMALAASSRMYFLATYRVGEMVEPFWEPFAATNLVVAFCFSLAAWWIVWLSLNLKAGRGPQSRAILLFAFSLLPLAIWGLRVVGIANWPPQFWEVIWIAAWTGFSFSELTRSHVETNPEPVDQSVLRASWTAFAGLALVSCLAGGWWFSQSVEYYQNFLLGFNDFGHFLQRVANTAEGRGVLLETPVLPMFWDHFNPGLLLMVPLWKVYPSVKLVFALQAAALAVGGILIFAISRRLGHSMLTALGFGIAWLIQPSVGQMNLAYTYGWHPITFAIPLLLSAILCLLSKQRAAALLCTLLALSMEESVFVIVALVSAVCAALPMFEQRYLKLNKASKLSSGRGLIEALPTVIWTVVAVVSVLGFVLVYKFSGLEEFQTGRFVALGNSPTEIVMSPLIRPDAFWGRVLKLENVMFVLLLWLPCGLPSLLRGWRYVLPTLLPLGVLIVWDHAPAHNLAFQYPSTLLPLFWLATLSGAMKSRFRSDTPSTLPSAMTALVTGLVLSLFVGQLPFSSPTLRDVEATAYGADSKLTRKSDEEDGRWLTSQLEKIKEGGDECLATTHIAAHLVGNRDIETVGQYVQRRDKLAALPDRKGTPILHYRWVILDRNDLATWSAADIAQVENEARESGFELITDQFNIGIYKRP